LIYQILSILLPGFGCELLGALNFKGMSSNLDCKLSAASYTGVIHRKSDEEVMKSDEKKLHLSELFHFCTYLHFWVHSN
jgi:hypothetical protein